MNPDRDPSALLHGGGRQEVRQPKPGTLLWTVTREGRTLRCELRDRGELGAELQILEHGLLMQGQLYPSAALAIEIAEKKLAAAKSAGWTHIEATQ